MSCLRRVNYFLGASDEDIKRLATCYWHTVEFGLVKSVDLHKDLCVINFREQDGLKAYGAGTVGVSNAMYVTTNMTV